MALANLAETADLTARGIDTSNPTLTNTMLAVASAVVRRGAGRVPIAETDSTVTLIAWGGQWLDLPGKPVTAVASVTVDGDSVDSDEYLLDGGRLWRRYGWGYDCDPATVVVALTHGLAEVPADVVDLVCSLVGAGIAAASEGYAAQDPRTVAEKIDDYSVTFAQGAGAVASVMELPAGTRAWLKAAFGGGVGLVEHR